MTPSALQTRSTDALCGLAQNFQIALLIRFFNLRDLLSVLHTHCCLWCTVSLDFAIGDQHMLHHVSQIQVHDIVCTHLPYGGHRIPDRHFLQEPVTKIIKYRDVVCERNSQNGPWRFECSNFTSKNVIYVVRVLVKRRETSVYSLRLISNLNEFPRSTVGLEPITFQSTSDDVNE